MESSDPTDSQDTAGRECGAATVRKARQKPATTCGKAVLEQNLPSTPWTHMALRGFWGRAVGGQEGSSARQVMGWPLAKQGHFSSPRDLPVCMEAWKERTSLISPQNKRMHQAEHLHPAS